MIYIVLNRISNIDLLGFQAYQIKWSAPEAYVTA